MTFLQRRGSALWGRSPWPRPKPFSLLQKKFKGVGPGPPTAPHLGQSSHFLCAGATDSP